MTRYLMLKGTLPKLGVAFGPTLTVPAHGREGPLRNLFEVAQTGWTGLVASMIDEWRRPQLITSRG